MKVVCSMPGCPNEKAATCWIEKCARSLCQEHSMSHGVMVVCPEHIFRIRQAASDSLLPPEDEEEDDAKVVQNWTPQQRRRLHARLDNMLESGDRIFLIALGRNKDHTEIMLERMIGRFQRTTPIEMLGALTRALHDYQKDLDADSVVEEIPDED